jgi:hydroxyacylglutathione hydrolase
VLKDNYSYLIVDGETNEAGVVDVSEVAPVVARLKQLQVEKFAVLTTHKHWDHSGGNDEISAKFPGLTIYAGVKDNVPGCTVPLNHNDTFNIGKLNVRAFHTPCHTSGHVLYHVTHPQDVENGAIFTGDTVFVGGIGAFFEGNASQMCDHMKLVSALPPNTCLYPGHEYTVNFLKFAHSVDPADTFVEHQLRKYEELRANGHPTVPSTIAEEVKQNVFMRVHEPDFMKRNGFTDSEKFMQHLYDTCP